MHQIWGGGLGISDLSNNNILAPSQHNSLSYSNSTISQYLKNAKDSNSKRVIIHNIVALYYTGIWYTYIHTCINLFLLKETKNSIVYKKAIIHIYIHIRTHTHTHTHTYIYIIQATTKK